MKRWIAFIVLTALLLLQCGCGKEDTAKAPDNQFMAGFSRVSIHTNKSEPLGSFGFRSSTGYLDHVAVTCVAITGDNNETVLLYTVDQLYSREEWVAPCRKKLAELTGVPEDHIMFGATHTHSAPDAGNRASAQYTEFFLDSICNAGQQAMEDRAPATIQAGSTQVDKLNYIRHYMMSDGSIAGDHFGTWDTATAVYNLSEPDRELQLIRFVREDKKDIVMANFQAHAKLASSGSTAHGLKNRTMMSSDFVGATREYVEANAEDVLFALYIGASGNVNPFDVYIKEQFHKEYATEKAYGKALGSIVVETLMFIEDASQEYEVQCSQTVLDGQLKTGTGTWGIELDAISLGDSICFVTTPFETFNSTGLAIKDGSPYETTFVLSNSNDNFSYIPDEAAFVYGGYEVGLSKFASGTAEQVSARLVEMLNELNK